MASEPTTAQFNFAQLLRIPFQALVADLHEQLAAAGYADIRPTHTIIFAHVGPEGMRLNELAERAQLTKQVINYLVNAVEEMGYIERIPDPLDGRGKIVRLTPLGEQVSQTGREIIGRIEREWAGKVGEQRIGELRALLEQLVAAIEG